MNNTEIEDKKVFYLPYIEQLIADNTIPNHQTWDSGQHSEEWYILGNLPNDKRAVYMSGQVFVATEILDEGYNTSYPVREEGCGPYTTSPLKGMFNKGLNVNERNLVLAARQLIKDHSKGIESQDTTKPLGQKHGLGKGLMDINRPLTKRERQQLGIPTDEPVIKEDDIEIEVEETL